jgi:hypothetical protein
MTLRFDLSQTVTLPYQALDRMATAQLCGQSSEVRVKAEIEKCYRRHNLGERFCNQSEMMKKKCERCRQQHGIVP